MIALDGPVRSTSISAILTVLLSNGTMMVRMSNSAAGLLYLCCDTWKEFVSACFPVGSIAVDFIPSCLSIFFALLIDIIDGPCYHATSPEQSSLQVHARLGPHRKLYPARDSKSMIVYRQHAHAFSTSSCPSSFRRSGAWR